VDTDGRAGRETARGRFEEVDEMYGTIARFQVKPGAEEKLLALGREWDSMTIPGYKGTYIYRMDSGGGEYYMAVAFESKEAYHANAESPDQDARYQQMRGLLAADPEWHDGEIIFAGG
jgi:antibiotic biosynthesis monooxygenase (ABM) superfamily enzyme